MEGKGTTYGIQTIQSTLGKKFWVSAILSGNDSLVRKTFSVMMDTFPAAEKENIGGCKKRWDFVFF